MKRAAAHKVPVNVRWAGLNDWQRKAVAGLLVLELRRPQRQRVELHEVQEIKQAQLQLKHGRLRFWVVAWQHHDRVERDLERHCAWRGQQLHGQWVVQNLQGCLLTCRST